MPSGDPGSFLRFLSVGAHALHLEIVQEAGPFQGSAERQARNAKRFLSRARFLLKSVSWDQSTSLSRDKTQASARCVADFLVRFERDVIKPLSEAQNKRSNASAKRDFEFASRSLRTLTFTLEA